MSRGDDRRPRPRSPKKFRVQCCVSGYSVIGQYVQLKIAEGTSTWWVEKSRYRICWGQADRPTSWSEQTYYDWVSTSTGVPLYALSCVSQCIGLTQDWESTVTETQFCSHLAVSRAGDISLQTEIWSWWERANERMNFSEYLTEHPSVLIKLSNMPMSIPAYTGAATAFLLY